MKIQFIGACHEVTGSCTLLEVDGRKYLVDCGMEQGIDMFENVPIPVPASLIDGVFLTHAHIDHSGMLPKLYKDVNKYFSFPIPLKKVASREEREHLIDSDDFPYDSKSIWHQDQKDGSDMFIATILQDGTLQFIDFEFNVYVSEPGTFKNLWY